MSTPRYRMKSRQVIALRHEGFSLTDKKGRAVGYSVEIVKCAWEQFEPTEYESFHMSRGPNFFAMTHQTRDGNGFGPTPENLTAATLEDLEKLVAKRVAGARKRLTKQFGGSQ